MKKRIDLLLVEKKLAPTREKAQALILSGQVLVEETPVTKAGQAVEVSAAIRVRGEIMPYVSRGGIKLAAALQSFSIGVEGRTALDVGASTGGFTHVLLEQGSSRIFAVDVGHGQMDWKIRSHPKVVVLEKINARNLTFDQIGQKVDLITVDVSFISLDKILEPLKAFAHERTDWITLIKPQFEVGRENVGKGGIVTDELARQEALTRIQAFGESVGLKRLELIESPITGTQGNKEYLAHWKLA